MIFISGLLLGLTLQLSVGPVFFTVLHKSMKEGAAAALNMVIGVTLVDAFYIIVSFSGMASLLKINFLHHLILIAGAIILILFGLSYFKPSPLSEDSMENPAIASTSNNFLYGIKLTLTNPLTIIFWSGTFGSLIASGQLSGWHTVMYYSFGCVLSTILFLGTFSFIGKYVIRFFNTRVLHWMDYAVGLFLIAFAINMLIQ